MQKYSSKLISLLSSLLLAGNLSTAYANNSPIKTKPAINPCVASMASRVDHELILQLYNCGALSDSDINQVAKFLQKNL